MCLSLMRMFEIGQRILRTKVYNMQKVINITLLMCILSASHWFRIGDKIDTSDYINTDTHALSYSNLR